MQYNDQFCVLLLFKYYLFSLSLILSCFNSIELKIPFFFFSCNEIGDRSKNDINKLILVKAHLNECERSILIKYSRYILFF